jgi:glycosyltransferase involved in cell wall biosynthesis
VITPVYNAQNYIKRCIESVAAQDYNNYEMTIIDDASTDNTVAVVKETIKNLPSDCRIRFNLIENTENVGALANQIKHGEKKSDGIIMLLDGDDWLANNPTIFNYYSSLYNEGYQFTYGSCWSLADDIPLIAQEYPPEIRREKSYRDYKFIWISIFNHLIE